MLYISVSSSYVPGLSDGLNSKGKQRYVDGSFGPSLSDPSHFAMDPLDTLLCYSSNYEK